MKISEVLLDGNDFRVKIEVPDRIGPGFDGRILVAFGEVGSDLDSPGFGSQTCEKLSIPYISVHQRKRTQYQYLSREVLSETLAPWSERFELFFYGTSLGGYCAAYYSRPLGARFLALSPRLPVHPVTDLRIPIRFKNAGFMHDMLYEGFDPNPSARRVVLLDKSNSVDRFYVETDMALAFSMLEVHDVPHAGHYVPRALLLSGILKSILLQFLRDESVTVEVAQERVLNWHVQRFHSSLDRGRYGHAIEHLDVLLQCQSPSQYASLVRELNLRFGQDERIN